MSKPFKVGDYVVPIHMDTWMNVFGAWNNSREPRIVTGRIWLFGWSYTLSGGSQPYSGKLLVKAFSPEQERALKELIES